jgi:hypothetical protein
MPKHEWASALLCNLIGVWQYEGLVALQPPQSMVFNALKDWLLQPPQSMVFNALKDWLLGGDPQQQETHKPPVYHRWAWAKASPTCMLVSRIKISKLPF